MGCALELAGPLVRTGMEFWFAFFTRYLLSFALFVLCGIIGPAASPWGSRVGKEGVLVIMIYGIWYLFF